MTQDNLQIGTRCYQAHFPLSANQLQSEHTNTLFQLPHLGLIQCRGERAAEFLQGQLTCDVRLVTPNTIQRGAQCNLKGRVLNLVTVIFFDDHYWLVLPVDLIETTIASLEKTALLSRVSLTAVNNIDVFGWVMSTEERPIQPHENLYIYANAPHEYIVLSKNKAFNAVIDTLDPKPTQGTELAWHYRQLQAKRISIYPETRGLFLPHRLNLHETGEISFNKGCYKGQEIIARTQYLGKLKHALTLFRIQLQNPPTLGEIIIDPQNNADLGVLVDYCPSDDQDQYLIATEYPM